MSGPLVSVVIPTFERPRRTQRAVDSVAEQTYDPLELVVVDDGSDPPLGPALSVPDGAFERSALLRHDRNRGGNAARNTGIDRASGEYVAFLDSDDEWEPAKIERQVARLERTPDAAMSYTGVRQLDADGNLNAIRDATERGDLSAALLRGNAVGTFSSVVVSAAALERVARPDPGMPCWQDWEWYLRLSTGVEFDAVDDPLTVRHNEGDQISGRYEPKRDEAYPVMRSRIWEFADTPREAHVGIAYLNYELGRAALSTRRYAEARRFLGRAIRDYRTEHRFYLYLACSGAQYPLLQRTKRGVVRLVRGSGPN
jgi:glycosyltransferase involved in cell wall biosynthesis